MPPTTTSGRPDPHHIAGLDGLRAIAVSAVLLFHADLYWARGGYLGVDLFFVISGFLITGLIATEVERNGRLAVGRFYWRRAKRLLPAVWLMMGAVAVAAMALAVDALPRLRADALASVFYVTNWELLAVHVSYFESMGRPPLLQHLWSLAIEEQYYILWAMCVPWGLRRWGRHKMAAVALVLAAASAAWMAIAAARMGYPGSGDPSRLYFGTDTHGFPLLLGSALGLLWQPERATWLVSRPRRALYGLCGLLALAGLLAMIGRLGEEVPALYPWGFLAAAAASLVLIATASHPVLALGRWLDCKPLRWIGLRSYGIYLWHWPIYMFIRPGIDLRSWTGNQALALRVGLTLVIAALSYRLVEMPIRRGALDRAWDAWRARAARQRQARRAAAARRQQTPRASKPPPAMPKRAWAWRTAGALLAVAAVVGAGIGVYRQHGRWPITAPSRAVHGGRTVIAAKSAHPAHHATVPVNAPRPAPMPATAPAPAHAIAPVVALQPVAAPVEIAHPGAPPAKVWHGKDLTAVGDSVLLGSSQLLGITLHGVDVHATVGWQAADVIKEFQALQKAKALRPVVLLHLGTNGYVYEGQLRQMLTLLKDCQRVVLVNTHVPRRWMQANNLLIDRVAADYPNVVVVRWSDISEGQPDYFVADGVHLTDRGQRAYIADIMRVGQLAPDPQHAPSPAAIDPTKTYATGSGDLSPTLVLAPRAAVPDAYWIKLAQCETDADWHHHPDTRSNGLAIAPLDWIEWGGLEFGKTPADATVAQQIEVANRISTQGWKPASGITVKPVGFARWRCTVALRPPAAPGAPELTFTRESVLAQSFHVGERGQVVRDLQTIIGTPVDGIYSKATERKYQDYLNRTGTPPVSPLKAGVQ